MKGWKERERLAAEIITALTEGSWYQDPCFECSARKNGSCCGCKDGLGYEKQIQDYRESLGDEAFNEVVAIGRLEHSIRDTKKAITGHRVKLARFLTPLYDEMVKKREEVTEFFSDENI